MIIKKREKVCPTYSKCNYDVHWLPYIAKCGYCDYPFKIIAKKETFDQDQKFIGQLAGVEFSSQSKLKVVSDILYIYYYLRCQPEPCG